MNEWLKRLLEQIKQVWGKWKPAQKGIFFGSIVVVILAIVLLVVFSSAPSMVPLIGTPVNDENLRERIVAELDSEIPGQYQIRPDNMIMVENQDAARRMRSILAREDLIPREADPWEIFDVERWTITDFERKINVRRAINRSLEQHLLALEEIDAVSVMIDLPEDALFTEDQKPYTASIQITPKPGSDITDSRQKIEGIEKLVMLAVSGLDKDNIVITDNYGTVLNDLQGLDQLDRLQLVERQLKQKRKLERELKQEILGELHDIYTPDRVKILKMDVDLDMSEETSTSTVYTFIEKTPDDPRTPFSEREVVPSLTISKENINEEFKGTGYNPEGPPGSEGHTPPQYKDLSNLVGEYTHTTERENNVVNEKNIAREERPFQIAGVTTGIAIDGWC